MLLVIESLCVRIMGEGNKFSSVLGKQFSGFLGKPIADP